jgi:radical SAM protein with 4Fe4S-binding SPASM domain
MSKLYKPSSFEERNAQQLENLMEDMLATIKELNIDILEVKFEKTCASCRLNKACGQCLVHSVFVKALNV